MQKLISEELADENETRAQQIRDRLELMIKKEVSAFGQQVDVEHFVRVATDLQTALDQHRSNLETLKRMATSVVARWNDYATTREGQTLLSCHELVFKQKLKDLDLALEKDQKEPGGSRAEDEFERVARMLVQVLDYEKGSDDVLKHHARVLQYHVASFSGTPIELPSDIDGVYALLLAMTPHGILLANDFRLIRSLSEEMMKPVNKRYHTNANFIARFPDYGYRKNKNLKPFIKYANSIKVATHYSKLLAPGLERRDDSLNEYLGVSPFRNQMCRRRNTVPGIAADPDIVQPKRKSKTWSLSSSVGRTRPSVFAPASRLSFLP